jgi:hypothetical protein
VVGPVMPGHLAPARRSAAAWVGHSSRDDAQRFNKFESGEVRAQAIVRTTAERQDGCRRLAGDVEPVGIVVCGRVMVGRGDVGHYERAGRNDDLTQLDVFARHSDEGENDWGITHQLVDRVAGQLGTPAQQCPLVGVVMQEVNRCCQLVAGGVGASSEQSAGQHDKFVVAEAVTVVLGADQVRDQVVGRHDGLLGSWSSRPSRPEARTIRRNS